MVRVDSFSREFSNLRFYNVLNFKDIISSSLKEIYALSLREHNSRIILVGLVAWFCRVNILLGLYKIYILLSWVGATIKAFRNMARYPLLIIKISVSKKSI